MHEIRFSLFLLRFMDVITDLDRNNCVEVS